MDPSKLLVAIVQALPFAFRAKQPGQVFLREKNMGHISLDTRHAIRVHTS